MFLLCYDGKNSPVMGDVFFRENLDVFFCKVQYVFMILFMYFILSIIRNFDLKEKNIDIIFVIKIINSCKSPALVV